MQNKSLSFLGILCLSTAFLINPAFAQNTETPTPAESPNIETPAPEAASTEQAPAPEAPSAEQAPALETPAPEVPAPEMAPVAPAPVMPTPNNNTSGVMGDLSSNEKEKMLMEMDFSNKQGEVLDFPARSSLGSLEMATLPNVDESLINGPTPMGASLSTKDLPSEQLLGRITSEVFQEMADLERGNVFLKLQMQKEQLKNDLEKLKATYRQARLDEIAKREDVVRSRINWWQEQESLRLEMERKKAETEAIEQQIAEAEELRTKLRTEAMADLANTPVAHAAAEEAASTAEETASQPQTPTEPEPVIERTNAIPQQASNLYELTGVRGIKGNLTARLRNKEDGSVLTIKEKQKLKTGHKIKKINRDSVIITFAGREEMILFATPKMEDESSSSEETKE